MAAGFDFAEEPPEVKRRIRYLPEVGALRETFTACEQYSSSRFILLSCRAVLGRAGMQATS